MRHIRRLADILHAAERSHVRARKIVIHHRIVGVEYINHTFTRIIGAQSPISAELRLSADLPRSKFQRAAERHEIVRAEIPHAGNAVQYMLVHVVFPVVKTEKLHISRRTQPGIDHRARIGIRLAVGDVGQRHLHGFGRIGRSGVRTAVRRHAVFAALTEIESEVGHLVGNGEFTVHKRNVALRPIETGRQYERGLLPGFDDLRPLGFRTRIGHLHNDIAFVLGIVARDFDVDALGPLRHRHRIADLVAERHAVLPFDENRIGRTGLDARGETEFVTAAVVRNRFRNGRGVVFGYTIVF